MRKILLIILFVSAFIFVSSCIGKQQNKDTNNKKYCNVDQDCAPATCCHPNDAVNKKYAPDCSNVFCTLSCEGPLDCGEGKIECIKNQCLIIPNKNI